MLIIKFKLGHLVFFHTKKSPKIHQKITKNSPKIHQKFVFSGSSSTAEMSTLQTKLKEIEKSVEGKDIKIKELEKELSTKKAAPSTSSNSSQLQTENEKLKKEVQELKSKSNSSPAAPGSSSYAASKEIKDLKDAISKHELSEEQLVIAKAKLTTENEELEGT